MAARPPLPAASGWACWAPSPWPRHPPNEAGSLWLQVPYWPASRGQVGVAGLLVSGGCAPARPPCHLIHLRNSVLPGPCPGSRAAQWDASQEIRVTWCHPSLPWGSGTDPLGAPVRTAQHRDHCAGHVRPPAAPLGPDERTRSPLSPRTRPQAEDARPRGPRLLGRSGPSTGTAHKATEAPLTPTTAPPCPSTS